MIRITTDSSMDIRRPGNNMVTVWKEKHSVCSKMKTQTLSHQLGGQTSNMLKEILQNEEKWEQDENLKLEKAEKRMVYG